MPMLPIIDLLIFLGWTTLAAGGVLKAIHVATSYRPTLAGLAPGDLLLVASCFLLLALTLSARSLVRQADVRQAGRASRMQDFRLAAPDTRHRAEELTGNGDARFGGEPADPAVAAARAAESGRG